ncbi:MAG: GNAT family N-acetyltransferase [Pseudomonadota bacterium]
MDIKQTEISLAHVDDAYQVATMSREIIEQGLQWSWTPERVGRCILAPDINVVTAKNDGDLIGFGIMFYGNSKAHLNLLGVDAEWRSHGVGHRLLEWLESCALTAGLECCQLELRESNNKARRFYAAHGYNEIERVRGYYQQRENAIRMAKNLREEFSLK